MTDEVLTLEEASEVAKVGKPLLTKAIKAEKLPAGLALGAGGYRITRRALLDWIDAGMPGTDVVGGETEAQRKARQVRVMAEARAKRGEP